MASPRGYALTPETTVSLDRAAQPCLFAFKGGLSGGLRVQKILIGNLFIELVVN